MLSSHRPAVNESDLSSVSDYTRFIDEVGTAVDEHGTANTAYAELGRQGLEDLISETAPQTYELLRASAYELRRGIGAFVLHGTGVDRIEDQSAQLLSITISSVYGTPTKTDRRLEQVAWPVKYDPGATMTRTFSQSLGEAAFHTDTQYFMHPEEYFGLFCVVSDIPGRGTNRLLRVNDIVQYLFSRDESKILAALQNPYPFRVPSVFTKSGDDSDVEIIWAPILTNDNQAIRYRKDTIDGALGVPGVSISDEQHDALQKMEETFAALSPLECHLQPSDWASILLLNDRLITHDVVKSTN